MDEVCRFVLFPSEGDRKTGRTEQTLRMAAACPLAAKTGCVSSAATVSPGKVNTCSQDCLRTLASSV